MSKENENNNEIILSDDVKARLDTVNWEGLKMFGITREMIEAKPNVARQLVYGGSTDLVFVNTPVFNGQVSLRMSPTKEDLGRVRVQGIKKTPTVDELYIFGSKITSEKAAEALLERISYANKDGKEIRGVLANANAGRQIGVKDKDGNTVMYLVGYNPDTHSLEAESVENLKARFTGEKQGGGEKTYKVYGVALTEDQIKAALTGKAIPHTGQTKDGESFKTYIQYSPVKRDFVEVHPKAIAEAMEHGLDAGVNWKPISMVIEEKRAERQERAQAKVQALKPAEAKEEKKGKGLK